MTDERIHEPKLAALRAYADDALRPAARERLERHLAQCATCGEALRGLQRYLALVPVDDAAALAAHELAAIDWTRVDAALEREVARSARRRRTRTLAWIGAGIAAAAWLAFASTAKTPTARVEPQRATPNERAAPVQPALASLHAEVTEIVGVATAIDAAAHSAPVTLDSLPAQGWTLETGPGSEVHVALADTAAFVVKANSRLELRVLQPGQVELALAHGEVVSQVQARRPGERYDVLAAARRVRVHGTRFGVEASPQALAVQVDEGVVQVLDDADGSLLAELRAPQRWIQEAAAVGHANSSALKRIASRLPRPRPAATGSAAWPALSVPTWPSIVQWQIDGAEAPASGELRMRVPPGKLQIIGRLADGRSMRGELVVDALGARFDPSGLRWINAGGTAGAAAPVAPAESLDSAAASAVIRASQPALQRCYERSMRGQAVGADSIVRVRVRIEIDARGGVRQVTLADAGAAPADLAACVRQVAHGWRFAAPGGSGLMFEAPLRFRPLH